MKRFILIGLMIFQGSLVMAENISIVPKPVKLERGSGFFTLDRETRILCTSDSKAEALLLQGYLAPSTGYMPAVAPDSGSVDNTIQLKIDSALTDMTEEGYRMEVSNDRIVISSPGKAGIFYGIQTLRQLLAVDVLGKRIRSEGGKIPCVVIKDDPSYSWRGMMLDVSRYFFDKEYVKRYLEIMAMHKLNVLHLHLVDDPGWRVEIDKYPKLTEIGGFRGKGVDRYGGYYTKEDMREIVEYGLKLHINIVPEIELPAHIQSALAAYPWLGCTDKQLEMPTKCYISREILCAGKESSYQFLEDVMTEVVELFPFQYIHIGGDEAKYDRWKECEHCKKKFQQEGMKDFHELQGYMTRRIEKFLRSKNRSIIGWDEITNMGLSSDAAVMTWHRPTTAAQAAKAGNSAVMALTGHAYFDTPESKLPGEPPAATWLAPISLRKAYDWEPMPTGLEGQARKNILGAQGCMWTDRFMHNPILQDLPVLNEERSYEYVEYLSLPRMAALAEVVWTPQEDRSWDDFERRMKVQYNRYSRNGYNFRVPQPIVDKPVKTEDGYKITMRSPVNQAGICYTTDGTYPSIYSRVYTKPVIVGNPQDFRAMTVVDKRHVSLAFALPEDKSKKYAKYGSVIGRWESGKISAGTYKPVEFDATGKIDKNGVYEVTFIYTGGDQRLDIEKVEVILHGKVVADDIHYGTTGGSNKDNIYRFEIKDFETGAGYTIRAHIRGDTGNDSNGLVLMKRSE
jgi:hexosaminidase